MRNPVDSYYNYIVQQMVTLNATVQLGFNEDGSSNIVTQPMCGYVESRDWPLTEPVEGGLYLLNIAKVPIGGTKAQRKYRYTMQWTWLLIGTNLTQLQVAQNRSARFAANAQIEENLRQANYPGFCPVSSFVPNQQTGVLTLTPVVSIYPKSQPEMVTWSDPQFKPQNKNSDSGLLWGAAAVDLEAYSDVYPAIA